MHPLLRAALATALYALLHSALASREAKDLAARALGSRFRNAFYRPLYILQAMVTFALLARYLVRLPSRVLYHVRGPWAVGMQAGRLAALLYGAWAAWTIGLPRLFGTAGLAAWLRRDASVPPEAEAQGPAHSAEEGMRVRGPFRFSRHPLNLIPVPVFALSPKMTDRGLVFTLVSAAYFWLGSRHEERRLEKAYGEAYRWYRASGVPFYFGTRTVRGWGAWVRARATEYLKGSPTRGDGWPGRRDGQEAQAAEAASRAL